MTITFQCSTTSSLHVCRTKLYCITMGTHMHGIRKEYYSNCLNHVIRCVWALHIVTPAVVWYVLAYRASYNEHRHTFRRVTCTCADTVILNVPQGHKSYVVWQNKWWGSIYTPSQVYLQYLQSSVKYCPSLHTLMSRNWSQTMSREVMYWIFVLYLLWISESLPSNVHTSEHFINI